MNTLLSTPVMGKSFMLRLLTAPLGLKDFCCLAEEKPDNLIKIHLMCGTLGKDINDLLRDWAKSHGYARMCLCQCEKGMVRDIEVKMK